MAARYRKKAEIMKQIIMMQAHRAEPNRRIWSLSGRFWKEEGLNCDSNKFRNHFRVSRSTFTFVVEQLNHFLKRENTRLRTPISVEKRVAIALYSLGSSAENRTVANCFGVGRSTAGEVLYEFCEAICTKFEREFINFYPPSADKIAEAIHGFEIHWGFPQTYGAVDGCYIEIKPPEDQATDYCNYKGWHSIVLLAAVDYKYRFTYINVGSPGRNNDSDIFEKSQLKYQHENNTLFYTDQKVIGNTSVPVGLIGDSAFRLSSFLMKPYPGSNMTAVLSKYRRVVENAFGHLKALQQGLNESTFSDSESRLQPQFSTTVGDNNLSAVDIRNAIAASLSQNEELGRRPVNCRMDVEELDGDGDGQLSSNAMDSSISNNAGDVSEQRI